jgi:hypothetical protein
MIEPALGLTFRLSRLDHLHVDVQLSTNVGWETEATRCGESPRMDGAEAPWPMAARRARRPGEPGARGHASHATLRLPCPLFYIESTPSPPGRNGAGAPGKRTGPAGEGAGMLLEAMSMFAVASVPRLLLVCLASGDREG